MTDDDFIIRPDIQFAMWNDEVGEYEPFGRYPFELFWTVPAPGDRLTIPHMAISVPVKIVSRHFIAQEHTKNWWWLVVEEVPAEEHRALTALDAEVRQVYAELEEERSQELHATLQRLTRKPPRKKR